MLDHFKLLQLEISNSCFNSDQIVYYSSYIVSLCYILMFLKTFHHSLSLKDLLGSVCKLFINVI